MVFTVLFVLSTVYIRASVCRKSLFFKKSACFQSLSPLGHSDGFASCKAWCVLISASLPKTPFPRKGAECGAAALTKQGRLKSVAHSRCTMQRHQRLTTRIGATSKAWMLWLLAKSFARCKTSRASDAKHPF